MESTNPPPQHHNPDTTQHSLNQYDNPYYLHSSDHAGLILVSDRLSSGADFHSWRRSVRMALNVRNKLGFIDGTTPKPPDNHRDAGSWSRCNDMVATWLINSVHKKIGQSLLFMSTAEAIWKNLMTRFKQDDAPRVFEIEQRLSSIQQGSMDISAYYTELVTLWEELKNYVDLPVCTCGKCECNAAGLWEKWQQRSRVIKFLMGLNESYEPTRRHILMLKPIPTIDDVFNMVTQDERQKSIKPSSKSENVAFQAAVAPPEMNLPVASSPMNADNSVYAAQAHFRPKQRPLCTYCGQTGHIAEKCFKLHGYPPGYIPGYKSARGSSSGSAPRGQFQSASRPPAFFQPTQPGYQPPRSNAVANVISAPPVSTSMNLDLSQLNADQVQHIIHQLQSHSQKSESVTPSPAPASITPDGFMAPQSTSGVFSGLDDW